MDFAVLTPHIKPHAMRRLTQNPGLFSWSINLAVSILPLSHLAFTSQVRSPVFVGAGTWGRSVVAGRWLWQPASVFEDPQKHMWKTSPQGSAGGGKKGWKEVSVHACPFLFPIDQNQSQGNPLSPPCGSDCFKWLCRQLHRQQDPTH